MSKFTASPIKTAVLKTGDNPALEIKAESATFKALSVLVSPNLNTESVLMKIQKALPVQAKRLIGPNKAGKIILTLENGTTKEIPVSQLSAYFSAVELLVNFSGNTGETQEEEEEI